MIKHDGKYCECIESLLPKTGKSSISASSVGDNIERASASIAEWESTPEMSQRQLVAKLREFGLEDYEVEMIQDRYFSEQKWAEIVKRRGWASSGAASYVLKRILSKLRKRGFSFV